MTIERKDDNDCDAPRARSLDDYLADPINWDDPRDGAPDGIAIEYEGDPPPGAPFRDERREWFIREVAKLARQVGLTMDSTRGRLLDFSDDFCSPPLPDRDVLALMAEEWGA